MRVFYEDWQMECCGTPFAVGDEVAWRLVRYDGRARRRGEGHGAEAWVENHGGPDRATTGRVAAIELVCREYLVHTDPRVRELMARPPAPTGPEPAGLVLLPAAHRAEPLPGTLTREPADASPGRFEEEPPAGGEGPYRVRRVEGLLVTLDVTGFRDLPREAPADHADDL
ncbi:DUF6578 domain-containing protein [Streptomyces sp. NPDC127190]|uniref:DUF6578 domain-containing protein n=1 Tax=unclassified Streptomyces TaxID=2593676 RepID=UPI003633DCC3